MSQIRELSEEIEDLAAKAVELTEKAGSLEVQLHQAGSMDPTIVAFTILMLACFVGYYVVWRVTPALHAPLMSVTNAISGIIIVGAMLALGPTDGDSTSRVLGFFAVLLASINIFGGFIVTRRMLEMYKKREPNT